MTLVDRSLRRQLTTAMAMAMALALLLSGTALAQTSGAVEIDDACNDVPDAGFPDVSDSNTFAEEIDCLAAYNITKGKNDGTYNPSGNVPRWQMALFIYRVAQIADDQLDEVDLPEANGDHPFNDLGGLNDQEAKRAIEVLSEIGVVKGKTATTYKPFNDIKRDQMASFINRLQDYIADAIGTDGFPEGGDAFNDDDGNVHEGNINSLANVGIVQGKSAGKYDPRGKVTRQQMAGFIMRYVEVNIDNGVLTSLFPGDNDEQPNNATLTVTPTDAVTLDADESRTYTASGLTGDSYRITLVNTDGYSIDGDGNAVFVDNDDSGTADAGDLEADITSVNGEDTGANDTTDVQTVPDPDDATDVVAPDADGEITFTVTGDGVSESLVPVVYVNGGDSTFLEVDEDGLPTETFGVGGQITFEGEAVAGDVTLTQTSATAGETVTGSVTDPNTVDSLTASGCGLSGEDLDLDEDGNFDLTIPADQPAGDCTLTFNVLRTDGTTSTTTIPFVVTAVAQQVTASPDLIMAEVTGTDNVTYTFDEAANGAALDPDQFRIYGPSGTPTDGDIAEIVGSDSTQVVVEFTDEENAIENAVRATIEDGAVEDGAGNSSYPSAAPLSGVGIAAGVTDGPDLVSVTNLEEEGGTLTADFVFDEAVDEIADDVGTALVDETSPVAGGFFLIGSTSDAQFVGQAVQDVSENGTTVTVEFLDSVPVGAITRGGVDDGTVTDDDDDGTPVTNSTQTEPRSGSIVSGTADRTDKPDLVSVTFVGDDTIAYEFDEAVVNDGGAAGDTIDEALFGIYDSDAAEFAADSAVRSDTNPKIVLATFLAAAGANEAVGAFVEPVAVVSTNDADTNLTHELPLEVEGQSAGRTAEPDLVSVDITFDAFGDAEVVYTFDDDVTAVGVAASAVTDFFLIDAEGQKFNPTGVGTADVDEDDDTVTFETDEFTPDEAATAVIGAVQDTDGLAEGADVDYTEGDVQAMHDNGA